ncbi:OmpA family protein [Stagnihabitans tardus]|uniref:17 kDa surface antigen n=1 Tax=Stagnihabitans tardus TaxID=2699202 RepID=A0AAE4Y675_9RHOB|nr:OmpA family protein [Stagnihabitans tardus]NBZ86563.1 OmpA family protein [Stagnihabitans tardus]
MIAKKTLVLSLVSLTALSACQTSTQRIQDPNYRTQNGAIAGAVGGAILGAAFSDNKSAGALRGALIGTAIGGGIGANLDAQAADMRARLGNPNITVTNMGDYLLVNLPQDVTFATGSANVRPDLARDIQSIAANLVTYPNSNIEVVGHTDNVGTAALNQDLSERRAYAVSSLLLSAGVPAARVVTYGKGFNQPVASNDSEAGRAKNRRVEILVRPKS